MELIKTTDQSIIDNWNWSSGSYVFFVCSIMLESAYSLNNEYFYRASGPILLYAIVVSMDGQWA